MNRLTQRCVICKDWKSKEPNCGHGLDNGGIAPWGWFAPSWIPAIELGPRVLSALNAENPVGIGGMDYIERIAR